jgi:hypothetical protein
MNKKLTLKLCFFFTLFLAVGNFGAHAEDFSELGVGWDIDDWEDWSNEYDTNGDGTVDTNEFDVYVDDAYANSTEPGPDYDDYMEHMGTNYDYDSSSNGSNDSSNNTSNDPNSGSNNTENCSTPTCECDPYYCYNSNEETYDCSDPNSSFYPCDEDPYLDDCPSGDPCECYGIGCDTSNSSTGTPPYNSQDSSPPPSNYNNTPTNNRDALVQSIINTLGLNLSSDEADYLLYSILPDELNLIYEFLSDNDSPEAKELAKFAILEFWDDGELDVIEKLFKYFEENGPEAVLDFIEIREELPLAKIERYLELMELLENEPFAILQDCMQQNGLDISNYQRLYDHTIPQACIERLAYTGSDDFKNQPLKTGNAVLANVDYYNVEISTYPDFNNDNIPDSNQEVYAKFRENFANLASGGKEDFEFSCNNPLGSNVSDVSWEFIPYYPSDVTQWNSTNPVTTMFIIDASAGSWMFDLIADDGAIMISNYTSNYWIGSTIQTPKSGTQPFSGNREWGWLINQSGNLELYARAVDVANVSKIISNTPGGSECKEDTYYNIGEATWSNLQEQIKDWIIENGGQAQVVPKVAIRFDKTKLKEMLESNESIDQIQCNQ